MFNYHIISDTHFNHEERMLKFCNRPNNYPERLFKNLARLTEKDILIHLGDVTFGNIVEAHEKYIKPLKCRKILVKGNHDHESQSKYYDMGWDFVCYSFSDTFFGKKILFSHYPKRIRDFDYNIFGHLHNNVKTMDDLEPENREIVTDKHLLFAVEYSNYQPYKLNHIIDKADKFRLLSQLKDPIKLNERDLRFDIYDEPMKNEKLFTLTHIPTNIQAISYGNFCMDGKSFASIKEDLIKELTEKIKNSGEKHENKM